MSFEHPIWLILTPLIVSAFAALFVFGLRRREALLGQFAAARLLDQLTKNAGRQRTWLKASLILLALALIGIALARPQYGVDWIERKARSLDIVFALDSSKSMLATDLRPTRLNRAKLAIIDLVKRLESDRIGLVVFAGNAFLQTPPTLDYSAFHENLDSISHSTLSRGGSDLGQAIREAAKAFPEDNTVKIVILLTDGEDQAQQAIDAAREVAAQGIKLYTIGIGTPEGEYLKIRNTQGDEVFIRDSTGQPVRSQLDEATLAEIARLSGGNYSRLSDQSLEHLYAAVLANLPRQERESKLQEVRTERYQWALAAALMCLILEHCIRRRGSALTQITVIIAMASLLLPAPCTAEEAVLQPDDSLQLPIPTAENSPSAGLDEATTDPRMLYNQAYEQLSTGKYPEAICLYRQTIELSEDVELERDALYNMAHATNQIAEAALQTQAFESAIESWQQAEALFQSVNEIDSSDTNSIDDAARIAARRQALEAFLQTPTPQDPQNSETNQQEQEQQASANDSDADPQGANDPASTDSSAQSEQRQDEQSGEQDAAANQPEAEQSGEQGSAPEQNEVDEPASATSKSTSESDQSAEPEASSAGTESTGDPAEDMQQASQEAGADEDKLEPPSATGASDSQTEADADGPSNAMSIEGMSLSEAQALLDSLRGAERLLPFSESPDNTQRSNRPEEIRDW